MARGGTSHRRDEWTELELQVLYDHVNDRDWYESARPLLRLRSENAIRTKMSNLRAEADIIPGTIGPRSVTRSQAYRDDAALGSARLLGALLEMDAA